MKLIKPSALIVASLISTNASAFDPTCVVTGVQLLCGTVEAIFKTGTATDLPANVKFSFDEKPGSFTFQINGGFVESKYNVVFDILGKYWNGTINLSVDNSTALVPNDTDYVHGIETWLHKQPYVEHPPGHAADGGLFQVTYLTQRNGAPKITPKSKALPHESHWDNYSASGYTHWVPNDDNDITQWNLVVQGGHAALPVPEPDTWLLLLGGLAAMSGFRRYARRSDRR